MTIIYRKTVPIVFYKTRRVNHSHVRSGLLQFLLLVLAQSHFSFNLSIGNWGCWQGTVRGACCSINNEWVNCVVVYLCVSKSSIFPSYFEIDGSNFFLAHLDKQNGHNCHD